MALTHEACRRYLDGWNDAAFERPKDGRRYADCGLEMVVELGNPLALRARALAMVGSSHRAVGELVHAEAAYNEALVLYRRALDLPPEAARLLALDEADLHRRLALLRMEQQRLDEALNAAARAAAIFRAAQDDHQLGQLLMVRGLIELKMNDPRAIRTMSCGLTKLDAMQSPNAHLAATHNLWLALVHFQPEPHILEQALAFLHESRLSKRSLRPSRRAHRRQRIGRRRKTLPDAKARFLQGRILIMLGEHQEARTLLETARRDLIELGTPLDVAAISLELVECYLWMREGERWPRIERLATEALTLLAPVPSAAEAHAAYELLQQAAQARSRRQIRRQLTQCRQLVSAAA